MHTYSCSMQIKSNQIIQIQTKTDEHQPPWQHAAARVYCTCDLGTGDES